VQVSPRSLGQGGRPPHIGGIEVRTPPLSRVGRRMEIQRRP
jgi:hypothetical protein